MENQGQNINQEGLYQLDIVNTSSEFQDDVIGNELIDIQFEEEVNLVKLIEKIESNELDKIFKEIKSSIIN